MKVDNPPFNLMIYIYLHLVYYYSSRMYLFLTYFCMECQGGVSEVSGQWSVGGE